MGQFYILHGLYTLAEHKNHSTYPLLQTEICIAVGWSKSESTFVSLMLPSEGGREALLVTP